MERFMFEVVLPAMILTLVVVFFVMLVALAVMLVEAVL